MKKRFLSLVLALVMVCTMLPTMPLTAEAATQESWLWPVKDCRIISSNFGWRDLYGSGYYDDMHRGIDISDGRGDLAVRASKSGSVITSINTCPHDNNDAACSCNGSAGNYIVIKHEDGTYSRYLHLRAAGMHSLGSVKQGDTIGYVGSSGQSYGYHLHFDICTDINNRYSTMLNPMPTNGEITIRNSYSLPEGWPSAKTTYVFEVNTLIKESYPSYCAIKVSASTTYIKSLPCSEKTDASSTNVEVASKGDQYQAIGLVENSAGNLWYKVKAKNGSTGYMYAGDTTYVAQSVSDIKGSGITAPTNHKAGATYVLTGTVSSTYNQLTAVSAYVYAGNSEQGAKETGASASVSGNSYSLGGSSVDNQTEFNKLPVGTHTYVVWASYKNYYAKSATSVGTNTGEIGVYKATFNVTSGTTSCSHSYSSKVTTAATCVSNGTRTYTCSKCGHSYTETIAATGSHNYVGKVTANAYCGGTGTKTYTCTGCSASYTETIPATGAHTWGGWGVKKAATCTTSGTKSRKCPVCYQEETQTIPATGHSYGSWVTTSAAGCTTTGTQKKTCSSCGDVQTQSIAATGHNYQSSIIDATCSEYEKIRYTCSKCQHYYEEYTNEKYSDWSTTKPSGVAENLIETKTQYRYRSITHSTEYTSWGSWSSWQESSVSESTLRDVETRTLYPYYYYYCKKCGDGTRWYSYGGNCGACGTTMVSSSGTVVWLTTPWSEAVSYQPYGSPTGKYAIHVNGLTYWKWTDGSPKTQYRYRTRSSYQITNYGNWSNWGDTAYSNTSSREVQTRTVYRYINRQLGDHTWAYSNITTQPTCTTAGIRTYYCYYCDGTKTESIAATGEHKWSPWTTTVEATCTQEGAQSRECGSCGQTQGQTLPVAEHDYGQWQTVAEPTCTATGQRKHVCNVCGETQTEEVSAKGHSYVSLTVKPQCETQGYTQHGCFDCFDYYEDTYVPALGHQYENGCCTRCNAKDPNFIGDSNNCISGLITSFGDDLAPVMIVLYSGETVVATITSTDGTYSFGMLASGVYTIAVSKPNHAPRTYEVTVADEDVILDVKIHLLGDINGDGLLNIMDVNRANAHAKKRSTLTGYDFACADINGDGAINIMDVNRMNAHAKKRALLW